MRQAAEDNDSDRLLRDWAARSEGWACLDQRVARCVGGWVEAAGVDRIRDDRDVSVPQITSGAQALSTGFRNSHHSVYGSECPLQKGIHVDTGQVMLAVQRMIRARRYAVRVDYADALVDANLSEDGQEEEEGGQGDVPPERHEG
eukprot:scaffold1245_cov252-Pinguiococcus_pyrenoidosus.AAC.3